MFFSQDGIYEIYKGKPQQNWNRKIWQLPINIYMKKKSVTCTNHTSKITKILVKKIREHAKLSIWDYHHCSFK